MQLAWSNLWPEETKYEVPLLVPGRNIGVATAAIEEKNLKKLKKSLCNLWIKDNYPWAAGKGESHSTHRTGFFECSRKYPLAPPDGQDTQVSAFTYAFCEQNHQQERKAAAKSSPIFFPSPEFAVHSLLTHILQSLELPGQAPALPSSITTLYSLEAIFPHPAILKKTKQTKPNKNQPNK